MLQVRIASATARCRWAARGVRKETWIILALIVAIVFAATYKANRSPRAMTLRKGTPSCWDLASSLEEPYTAQYDFNPDGVDVNGEMWADYYWEGNITKEHIDDSMYRDERSYVKFKIINNKLYLKETSLLGQVPVVKNKAKAFMDQVLITLAWFKIPDVDILVDLEDIQQHSHVPSLVLAFRAQGGAFPGFSMPTRNIIRSALGPSQLKLFHECLMDRYPLGSSRIPKAVWRGRWERISSIQVPRAKLVRAASRVPHIADVKFTQYRQKCLTDTCIQDLADDQSYDPRRTIAMAKRQFPPGNQIELELWNKYAFLVDLDGAGHSEDLGLLLHFNTPILRQDAQYPTYLWSQLVKENILELFAKNASNFVPKLEAMMLQWKNNPLDYHAHRVDRMHQFALSRLTHYGVARSMAYALTVYANKAQWTPQMDERYRRVFPDDDILQTLPKLFLDRISYMP